MRRWRGASWWFAVLLLSPLLLPLALHTRRHALRLAPAGGAQSGLAGAEWSGEPLRLLVLGESTVVGVGVDCMQQALASQLATTLAARQRRPVAWRACGENGITAAQACQRLVPQVREQSFDLVLLVFGVNDSTHLSSMRAWQQALGALARHFAASGARVAFSAVPPLQHFSALPWLMRILLGMRASLLDAGLRQVAGQLGVGHCPVNLRFSAEYLALDGYHPSRLGYKVWAEGLAPLLTPTPNPSAL